MPRTGASHYDKIAERLLRGNVDLWERPLRRHDSASGQCHEIWCMQTMVATNSKAQAEGGVGTSMHKRIT